LPNRPERDQRWDHQEWEPSGALTSALEEMSPVALRGQNGDRARLKPHLGEALETLERLKRQRGLSEREKMRGGALGMLLRAMEQVK
jgi:hypothetical protein